VSAVVAVGVFDGLHLGHDAILDHALFAARARGARSVVVSFDPHPDLVLAPSFQALPPLTPIPEKRARLESRGVDHFEVLPFTRELAALSPETFVRDHLIEPFGMTLLVVGEDFALGKGRAGNVRRLAEIGGAMGFGVEPVALLAREGGPITSTRIRERLSRGDVAGAARLLGRSYDLAGAVVPGAAIGRTLGFPTANLRLHEEKFLPADGVYAAMARIGGEAESRPAALSLGVRPTFDGLARVIEVYLLDWNGDLSGREMAIECVDWIRAQEKFDGPADLIRAMERDVAEIRARLASLSPRGAGASSPPVAG
jgi:riboflavin kinase/FMN adenylyltransferase